MKILVVEDRDLDAEILRLMLIRVLGSEPEIILRQTLQSALDYLEHYQDAINLVLLDLNLPDSAPAETLQRMLAQPLSVHIVITSAYLSPPVTELAKAANIPYVDKNDIINIALLGAAVEQALPGAAGASSE